MAKIECELERVDLSDGNGRMVPGVVLRCSECGHETESFGESAKSIRRCLALMREECPNEGTNYYTCDELGDG